MNLKEHLLRAKELCESRGGRPWDPVSNIPFGLCGHKATLNLKVHPPRAQELCSCVKVDVAVLSSRL